jgi:GNAT superfamily N-acetyltransferase
MSPSRLQSQFEVRPWADEDEPEVLELLNTVLGSGLSGRWSSEIFRWKHFDNPFGRSFLFVAKAGGNVVGLRAFMQWRFDVGNRTLRAVRAVDTATHPHYQRRGVFSELTREALEHVRDSADLVFNTPNANSLPGYLKLGWQSVGETPVAVRVRRPLRFLAGLSSVRQPLEAPSAGPAGAAETAAEALSNDPMVSAFLQEAARPSPRLSTARDVDYLRWRYGSQPVFDYRAVRVHRNGRLSGLAIFRLARRGRLLESRLLDLITGPGDRRSVSTLLRRVARAASVDHLVCSSLPGAQPGPEVRRRAGFVRMPSRTTLVVRPFAPIAPDPTDLGSWALSLGDLELF